jgi:signal transduction histidine kinase
MLSILLASVSFLSLLTLVVYYTNEALEDALLDTQTRFELDNIRKLLDQDPAAALPGSASLTVYLESRRAARPVPGYLANLDPGVHHDIRLEDKAVHILVEDYNDDRIYLQYDVTEIERSEDLLLLILASAWIVLLVLIFFIARILSRRLSGPISRLSQELSQIEPGQRGIRLGEHYADDEVGRIAQAFDSYTAKMDDYVEKQHAFAAMASHELRSPLTIVQTSADLIASRHGDADTLPHLNKIRRAASNMANMIHALLAVTRDRPTGTAHTQVAILPLVDEIVASMTAEIDAKQIRVDNRLQEDAVIETDPTLLAVVLTNLIRNAVKHGEQSSIVIEIVNGGLSIIDDGIGIDAQSLEHIFDFGFSGQHSQGYGVGLYISRLACEYLDWKLRLEPNPGGGIIARIDFGA